MTDVSDLEAQLDVVDFYCDRIDMRLFVEERRHLEEEIK